MALRGKANENHFQTLSRLAGALRRAGWTAVEEIPAAVDLQASRPDGSGRVLFEVKTLSGSNEVSQCRAAWGQLLEYRFKTAGTRYHPSRCSSKISPTLSLRYSIA